MFHFPARRSRRKEKRDVWEGAAAGEEGREEEEEASEQYMSVERAGGEREGEKRERRGFRFDVGVFLTAIILQPPEFHQHKLC